VDFRRGAHVGEDTWLQVVPTFGRHDRFPPGALDEQLARIAADIALQLVDRSPWSTPQSPHRLDRRRKQPTIRNRHISARGDATHSAVWGGPPPAKTGILAGTQ